MSIDVNCTAWKGFRTGEWRHLVNVRNFIQKNYTPYTGDESFLAPTTKRTDKVWGRAHELILEELEKGILDERPILSQASTTSVLDISTRTTR